ncbi:MAG TPA: ABC transporter substrate-binding protein [Clostridia bacterium]|nr:ABC transporter substrate-binding protein [Clostridia bacterium]
MKKYLSLVIVILMLALAFAGCSGGSGAGDTSVLYHAISSEPFITLDPSAENSNGIYVLQNVYETLTRYNSETNEVEPWLATEWTKNEDGTVWEFKLREDVTFHDGTPLTAESVKKSIERTVNMGLGASYIWSSLASVEVVDEHTVRFTCTQSAAVDLIASAAYASYIISDAACDQNSDWFNSPDGNDGGTGPYMVKSLAAGDQVVLTGYDGYWREWKEGSYKNVLIKKSMESSARRQLLESGEAQIADRLSSTDLKAVAEEGNLSVLYESTYDNIIIFLNTEKAPMDNADFRRALAYAFPYQEVVENVLENRGAQSRGMVPPGLWAHSEDLMQYTFDLEKAQEYLDKSGVDTTNLTLEFAIQSGTAEYRDLAQLWQIYLKQIGVNIEIRERNWDSHWEYAKNPNPEERQDMFIMIWWPDYASPISWFQSLVHSEESIFFNLSYIKDPALDAKIEEADRLTATDRAEAERIYIEVQQEVLDQAYMIFPYDRVEAAVVSKTIEGFDRSPAYPTAVQYFDIVKAK